MNKLDLRPYLTGLEHSESSPWSCLKALLISGVVVRVDETSSTYACPLQVHVKLACQAKFGLPPQTIYFPPEQLYATMMELCPLWAHGRPLGRSLYSALWDRLSDESFATSEQGYFTRLSISLKQEVYICYEMQQLQSVWTHASNSTAILDGLEPFYDGTSIQILWKARFCLENFEMVWVTGDAFYILQFFYHPHPMPRGYRERTQRLVNCFTSAISIQC